jgi:hypothetical protein
MTWRYFGRRDGLNVVRDVYRLPAEACSGTDFTFDNFRIMEKRMPDGHWVGGQQNSPAEKSWMDGWFNLEDEISEEEMERLSNPARP